MVRGLKKTEYSVIQDIQRKSILKALMRLFLPDHRAPETFRYAETDYNLFTWSMQANITGVLSNNLLIATYLWALYNPLRLWHLSSDARGQTVETIWEQRGCKHNDFFTWFLQSNTQNTKITRSWLLYNNAVIVLGRRTDLCKGFLICCSSVPPVENGHSAATNKKCCVN